ncbi:hypothetical protein T492DRAFT_1030699 [Pavlovales sp. CCMP2436]|nr:hypothetical protein T492DRAFT_1030699 [Pavlovales sp. CCMP2436]|mmetsp:Transcript_4392/g.11224  ORF Transcript_4392/g.11224 Transcript_4392/m.11224 type:complete len:306 (+) Transcript_4392:242-1159(+)
MQGGALRKLSNLGLALQLATAPARAFSSAALAALEAQAASTRAGLQLPPHAVEPCAFDSAYARTDGTTRGWSNWLVPGSLMIGRYPHLDPIAVAPRAGSHAFQGGPTELEVEAHLDKVWAAGVSTFVCLQDELPPQQDGDAWPADERIYLASEAGRARFPGPFVRYAAAAARAAEKAGGGKPFFFEHLPIVDLSLPTDEEATLVLLGSLLRRIHPGGPNGGSAVYIHCWGGRGRAGLIGGALLACLRPELGGEQVVKAVQDGYDTRPGSKAQKGSLARSPQTDEQRAWLRDFAERMDRIRIGPTP